ncbi:DMT family transporter [Nonomuraea endophytica]|uniref:DMT family transporter n=1 Tax=Nonomuraea endophytica TaxID=714136 RepID=UPI0037C6E5CD
MAWILLIIAGAFEVVMALSLKMSNGLSHLWWTISFLGFAVLSFGLLAYSLKSLEVGTAYAVWTGIGAVGTAIVGMIAMGDNVSFARIASIALIVVGVIGLNLAGGGAH